MSDSLREYTKNMKCSKSERIRSLEDFPYSARILFLNICNSFLIPSILLNYFREVLSIPIVKLSPIILIFVVIVWYLILMVNKPHQMDGTKVILDTLGIYLRTKSISCPKTASEKILIMSLFIFTIIMGGLFAEFVYNNLVKPPFDQNIDSLEELADTGLNIWAEKYVMDYLQEYSDNMKYNIKKKSNAYGLSLEATQWETGGNVV